MGKHSMKQHAPKGSSVVRAVTHRPQRERTITFRDGTHYFYAPNGQLIRVPDAVWEQAQAKR